MFTTVHANNVVDVLGRFLNMKVELYNFVSALNCILAQRLVRKICSHCGRRSQYPARTLLEAGLDPEALSRTRTSTRGRVASSATAPAFTGGWRSRSSSTCPTGSAGSILERRPASEIKQAAKEEGMKFLRDAALAKVFEGSTTLKEINKVTFVE